MEPTADREDRPATWVTVPPIATAGLFVVWVLMVLVGGNEVDRWIVVNAHVTERPWVLAVLYITRLGDWEVLMALPFFAAAWFLYRRRRRLALFLLGSVVLGRLLVEIQKGVLGRARPEEHEAFVEVESFAYPSGHAANSMIVYLLLALLLVEQRDRRKIAAAAAVILSLMIGVSRVLLGVHWPTDVIGGWAFGLLWVLISLWICRRLSFDRRSDPVQG